MRVPKPLEAVPRLALGVLLLSAALANSFCQSSGSNARRPLRTGAEQSGSLLCPGTFPTDLTSNNCDYTQRMRLRQWINSSITDEAMLGAVVYGTGAQIIKSPTEWGRTWGGYGDRISVRYTQSAARATAEYLVGSLLDDDPRHVSYKDDPHSLYGNKIVTCTPGQAIEVVQHGVPSHLLARRIGHAFLDSVMVRRSNPCGIGKRLPAIDRLVGVSASAYGGYAWYPQAENHFANAGERAAGAFGSTLAGSFYEEFKPEISLLLTKIFVQNKKQ